MCPRCASGRGIGAISGTGGGGGLGELWGWGGGERDGGGMARGGEGDEVGMR